MIGLLDWLDISRSCGV